MITSEEGGGVRRSLIPSRNGFSSKDLALMTVRMTGGV
jgi:hypothetical protein